MRLKLCINQSPQTTSDQQQVYYWCITRVSQVFHTCVLQVCHRCITGVSHMCITGVLQVY